MNRPPSSATQRSRSWLWLLGGFLLLGIISMIVVALVASWLILPYFQAEKSVTLIINGQPQIAVTDTNTIAELLNELAIHLSEGDTVAPALTSRVTENLTIEVARARSVTVTIDGHSQVYRTHLENPAQILESMGMMVGRNDEISVDGTRVQADQLGDWPVPATEISLRRTLTLQLVDGGRQQQIETTSQTVGEALFDAGVTLYIADEVAPDLNATVTPDMVIRITRAQPLYVIADGAVVETRAQGQTVVDALAEAGVALVGQDYAMPGENAPLLPGMRIRVIRVSEEMITEETTQPFETVFQADSTLEIDQRQEIQTGQEGISRTTIRVRYENGIEISRQPSETVVVQEPRNRVIAYGTNIVLRTVDTPQGPRQYWRRIRMWATSYHPEALGGDDRTATGDTLQKGIVASRTDLIRYGSEVFVPGYGIGKMADTGPIYRPLFIDLGYSDADYQPWARWVDVYLLAPVPDEIMYILPG